MYELGIAHQLFGPERVVILTQSSEFSEVFDIHQFRQFQYSPDNLTALIHELPVLLKAARERPAIWRAGRLFEDGLSERGISQQP